MIARSRRTPGALLSIVLSMTTGIVAGPAVAEWDYGIEGGTVIRGGNTSTRLRARASNDVRPLSHYVYAEWLPSNAGSGYRAGYLPRYWFDERLYVFGEGEGRVDRPLGIERGLSLIGGAGYRLFDSDIAGFGVELGGGARSTLFEALPGQADGLEEQEGLGVARANAFRELADLLRVEIDVDLLQGSRLGEVRAEAALLYRVSGGAVRLGYRATRITFPESDLDPIDDTQTSVSFTYGF